MCGVTDQVRACDACGGQLYHKPGCELDRQGIVIEAMDSLRWAYAGIPLYFICPCELGYRGFQYCTHTEEVTSAGWRVAKASIQD